MGNITLMLDSKKVNDGKPKDKAIIKKATPPDGLSSGDINVDDFSITIQIDNYKYEMTELTGTLMQKGDKFIYKPNIAVTEKIKLTYPQKQ